MFYFLFQIYFFELKNWIEKTYSIPFWVVCIIRGVSDSLSDNFHGGLNGVIIFFLKQPNRLKQNIRFCWGIRSIQKIDWF